MTIRKLLLSGAVFSGLIATSLGFTQSASANTFTVFPNSNWALSKIEAKQLGGDPYCALARRFSENLVLTIARNSGDESSIALDFQKPVVSTGQSYNISLNPGFSQSRTYEVQPVSANAVVVRLGKDFAFYDALNRSGRLAVSVDGQAYVFNLPDFGMGQSQLNGCLLDLNNPQRGVSASADSVQSTEQQLNVLRKENEELRSLLEKEREAFESRLSNASGDASKLSSLTSRMSDLELENQALQQQLNIASAPVPEATCAVPDDSAEQALKAEVSNLKKQNDKLRNDINIMSAQLGSAEASKGQQVAASAEAYEKIALLENQLLEADKRAENVLNETAEARAEYEAAQNELATLNKRVQELEGQVQASSQKAEMATQGIADAEKRATEANAKLAEANERAAEAQRIYEEAQLKTSAADQKLAEIKEKTLIAEQELAAAQQAMASMDGKVEELGLEKKEADQRLAEVQAQANEAQEKYEQATQTVSRLELQLAEAQERAQIGGVKAEQLDSLSSEKTALKAQLASAQEQIAKLKAQNGEALNQSEVTVAELQAELATARQELFVAESKIGELEGTNSNALQEALEKTGTLEQELATARQQLEQVKSTTGVSLQDARSQADTTAAELEAVKQELAALKGEKQELGTTQSAELAQAKEQALLAEQRLVSTKQELAELKKYVDGTEARSVDEVRALETELEALKATLAQARQESLATKAEADEKLRLAEDKLAQAQKEAVQYRSELASNEQQVSTALQAQNTSQVSSESLNSELQAALAKAERAEQRALDAEKKLAQARAELRDTEKVIDLAQNSMPEAGENWDAGFASSDISSVDIIEIQRIAERANERAVLAERKLDEAYEKLAIAEMAIEEFEGGGTPSYNKSSDSMAIASNVEPTESAIKTEVVFETDPELVALVDTLEARVDELEQENANLKASLVSAESQIASLRLAAETPQGQAQASVIPASVSTADFKALDTSAKKIKSLEMELANVVAERDALAVQVSSMTSAAEEGLLSVASGDWDLEAATRRFNEAEREARRLGAQIEKERDMCAAEKRQIEYMLFDPAIASQEQIAKFEELESVASSADIRIREYQKQAADAENRVAQLQETIAGNEQQLAQANGRIASLEQTIQKNAVNPDELAKLKQELQMVKQEKAVLETEVKVSAAEAARASAQQAQVAAAKNVSRPDNTVRAANIARAESGRVSRPVEDTQMAATQPRETSREVSRPIRDEVSAAPIGKGEATPRNVSRPVVQPTRQTASIFMPADAFDDLLQEAILSTKAPVKQVEEGKANKASFVWETNNDLYGSAEQYALKEITQFDNMVNGYLKRTEDRCEGDFAAVPASMQDSGTIRVSAYEVACIGNDAKASASVIFFNGGGLFTAIAHETDLDSMDVAMDARDKLISTLMQMEVAYK